MVETKYKKQSIPYIDFSREYQNYKNEFDQAYFRVMEKGYFILGNEVLEFEKEFADFCGSKFAVGLGSGLDALILCLEAWGIGIGDEVIVCANTYIATAFAASRLGAVPVFVDVHTKTFNIDVDLIEAAITERTKVIIPTHLYGQMADMEAINSLAKKYNLKVLEDAAQAQGARQRGEICGTHSDAVAFSFYPTKNLGAFGDAGAVTTNDPLLYDKLLYLRNNGSKTKFYYDYIGYNSRLDEIQAAFLKVKLKHLSKWNETRNYLAGIYNTGLKGLENIILPSVEEFNESVWHVYCVRILDSKRDELINFLKAKGISTNIHYPHPVHLQNYYQDLEYGLGDFPIAEKLAGEILSLPLSPFHSEEEIIQVVNTIKLFYKEN